jgi:superfamily II DNA or RNA helicase
MAGFISEERLAYGPWQALERAVARLLDHWGFSDVAVVGGSGDQGADVVASINGQRWVVQCKYRSAGAIGEDAITEAVRSMSAYEADVAVVATNQYFAQAAYQAQNKFRSNGIDVRLWNGANLLSNYKQLPTSSRRHREMRTYQLDAVESVERARGQGSDKALVVMATGLGKSLVASQLAANELARNTGQTVLVLAHTVDLVRQLDQSFWPQLPKGVSTHLWTDGESPAYTGGIVFATWQSLHAHARREELVRRFGLVIVDEAHHAPSVSFSRLLGELKPRFLVGLTATPWRGDKASLRELFGDPVFTMDIIDGMQRGYLAEVDYRMLTDELDWEEVALRSREGLTVRDLNRLLVLPERDVAVGEVVASHYQKKGNARTLVFCRSIEHAERMRQLLATLGISSAVIHASLPRELRFRNLTSFRRGQVHCLVSVEMLNEGIDVPDVNMVVFVRVTHSRRIFVQQLGRGLRLSKGKSNVLVLDFVADIRRLAAGVSMNQSAALRAKGPEVLRFGDGRIVAFNNDKPLSFFKEYLGDVASIEDLDDDSRLRFPSR